MVGSDCHIGGTHDLVMVADLLHPVGAPAGYTSYRKDRSEELYRKSKHVIDKAGIEVYVRTYALINLSLRVFSVGDYLFSQPVTRQVFSA